MLHIILKGITVLFQILDQQDRGIVWTCLSWNVKYGHDPIILVDEYDVDILDPSGIGLGNPNI